MYVAGPLGLNGATKITMTDPPRVASIEPSACWTCVPGPETLTMIDCPVPTFVSCNVRLPLMSTRTSPFASTGYILTYSLFDTGRSEEHTSELQSRGHLVCRLLLEKKKKERTSLYS